MSYTATIKYLELGTRYVVSRKYNHFLNDCLDYAGQSRNMRGPLMVEVDSIHIANSGVRGFVYAGMSPQRVSGIPHEIHTKFLDLGIFGPDC